MDEYDWGSVAGTCVGPPELYPPADWADGAPELKPPADRDVRPFGEKLLAEKEACEKPLPVELTW